MTRDISPPNKISDFTLESQNDDNLSITLSWTAPGGDYDTGKGKFVQIFLLLSQNSFVGFGYGLYQIRVTVSFSQLSV